jgi:putative IMPACT (imprinted ancient) family translation regulator
VTAIDGATIQPLIKSSRLLLQFPYPDEHVVRHAIQQAELTVGPVHHATMVRIEVQLPASSVDSFTARLNDRLQGRLVWESIDPA